MGWQKNLWGALGLGRRDPAEVHSLSPNRAILEALCQHNALSQVIRHEQESAGVKQIQSQLENAKVCVIE